ncbi:hypothetical protein [Paraburkholderia youngii]|uniref:hypothetical protein n=1 Tax=Paraburkholderia youngii TaxID=2782701 RepID=UPI003D232CA0
MGNSLFDEMLRAVLALFDYCLARFGDRPLSEEESVAMVVGFFEAKMTGTDRPDAPMGLGLNWRPVQDSTVKRYIAGINAFDQFVVGFYKAGPLLRVEYHVATSWFMYAEFARREKFDLLLHLFTARRHEKPTVSPSPPKVHARYQRRYQPSPKSFPLDMFVELVETSPNPRDKMLFLQLFGLAMRQSEPLHLFLSDIMGTTDLGEARVRLGDPELGEWRWRDDSGKMRIGTRSSYLEKEWKNNQFRNSNPELYRLQPRTKYRGSSMYVGYKGMTFHDSPGASADSFGYEAHWIDPRLGIYFRKCLEAYLREHFYGKPRRWPFHPWLYIQLDTTGYGMPMTLPALKKVWDRSLRRIGLEDTGLGLHSLRHLAGYYCATVLTLSKDMTQTLLRHRHASSTEVYFHLSPLEVRRQIIKGVTGGVEIEEPTPKLIVPAHWTS